ncbi:MAG: DUF6064 family protein [Brevefilum sp.]|nr:DUF6064 family protein [Brevefilum sp.]MDW7754080.1 DUF6064 family protein [Brevefilum sp.]
MITGEQLLDAFAAYNQLIWPMHIIAYVLGVIAVFLAIKKSLWASRVNFGVLAFLWLWVALLFWLPSAGQGFTIGYAFMALFLIEAVLFLIQAVKPGITFGTHNKVQTVAGVTMIFYTMVGYPLIGILVGHNYPQAAFIGLFPCPLTLFTFGLLLLASSAIPIYLLIVPLFWGLSGVLWISIGMWEDVGMVLGSLVSIVLILRRNKKQKAEEQIKNQEKSSEAWSLNVGE